MYDAIYLASPGARYPGVGSQVGLRKNYYRGTVDTLKSARVRACAQSLSRVHPMHFATPCTVAPQAPLSRENAKCGYFLCWFATLIIAVGFWVTNGRILVPCTVELRYVALCLKNKKVKF